MRLIPSLALSVFLGACAISSTTLPADAQIILAVGVPPPPLPVYVQPVIPAPDYFWTPGYWAYDELGGYFWVPGTWVQAPRPGLLWTPGYWAFTDGEYAYRPGYWDREVGFYGGVNYGYGYGGTGYGGGYWTGDRFFYNRTVNNIGNVAVTNVYSKTVVVNDTSRVSFNGGQGGLAAQPTAQQRAVASQPHVQPTAVQQQHVQTASQDTSLRESQNKGRPPVAASSRPNDFKGPGVVQAQTAGSRPAGQAIPTGGAPGRAQPGGPGHALPVPTAPAAGTAKGTGTPALRQGQPAGDAATRTAPAQRSPSRTEAAPRQAPAARPQSEPRQTRPAQGGGQPQVERRPAQVPQRQPAQPQVQRQPAQPQAQRQQAQPQVQRQPQPQAQRPPQPQAQRPPQPAAQPRPQAAQPRPQAAQPRPQGQPHPQGGAHPNEPGRP